ncbi:hypothetical protein [Singulisphaera sp. PoT]|uniref:hypothetical protein n=1 Tax=Singulisphaera sp. PoT TaxID=3411797 RepID=UPI003BF504F2
MPSQSRKFSQITQNSYNNKCGPLIFAAHSGKISTKRLRLSANEGTNHAVPLTLELAQAVAIGAFNPYVVTPEWLVRFGVYPKKGQCRFRLVPLGNGTAFEFKHGSAQIDWQVDNQKLSVASADRSIDCGMTVSKVLELLPHTPVQAIGHNFHFSATKEDWGNRPAPMLGSKGLEDFEKAEQVRWIGTLRRNGTRIEVTLAHEADAVAILFNHHRTMNLELARKALVVEEQIKEAKEAAGEFSKDFGVSCELLRSLFDMELL